MHTSYKPDVRLHARDYCVRPVTHRTALEIVSRYHYAGGGSNTGIAFDGLFARSRPDECLGVAWWMLPHAGAAKWAARRFGIDPRRVLMLTRSCLVPTYVTVDGQPRGIPNAASFLIGRSIRARRAEGRFDVLLTYADEWANRAPVGKRPGIMYQATNWRDDGWTEPRATWIDPESGRQVCAYTSGVTRTSAQMEALGYALAGHYRRRRYVMLIGSAPERPQQMPLDLAA